MKDDNNGLIVILLGVIAAVLLFGREAVLSGVGNLFWVAVFLVVVGIIVAIVGGFFKSIVEDIQSHRDKGEAWIGLIFTYIGVVGNILLGLYAVLIAWNQSISIKQALGQIPFSAIPIMMVFGGFGFLIVEGFLKGDKSNSSKGGAQSVGFRLSSIPSKLLNLGKWWLKGATAPVWAFKNERAKIRSKAQANIFDYIVLGWESLMGLFIFIIWLYTCFLIVSIPFILIHSI